MLAIQVGEHLAGFRIQQEKARKGAVEDRGMRYLLLNLFGKMALE